MGRRGEGKKEGKRKGRRGREEREGAERRREGKERRMERERERRTENMRRSVVTTQGLGGELTVGTCEGSSGQRPAPACAPGTWRWYVHAAASLQDGAWEGE